MTHLPFPGRWEIRLLSAGGIASRMRAKGFLSPGLDISQLSPQRGECEQGQGGKLPPVPSLTSLSGREDLGKGQSRRKRQQWVWFGAAGIQPGLGLGIITT